MGLELHFSSTGQLMWLEPETQGDKAILISSDAPQHMTRNEAVKWLGVDDGLDTGVYANDQEQGEEEEDHQEGEEEEDDDAPADGEEDGEGEEEEEEE
jgi:hypothetical protein